MRIILTISFLLCYTFSFSQSKTYFSSLDVFELEWVSDPQISPNGKQVVYVRRGMDIMEDKRQSRLWLVDVNGKKHQPLTGLEVNESNPIWSPKGDEIAFLASSRSKGKEIYIYDIKTKTAARISNLADSPRNIIWSPDGKSLAFSMFMPTKELVLVKPSRKPKGAKWAKSPRVTTRLKHEADGAGYIKPGFTHHFIIISSC